MNDDDDPIGPGVATAVRCGAGRRGHSKALTLKPTLEVELFAVRAIGMDANFTGRFSAEQVHCKGDHDGALTKMVFEFSDVLAPAVWWGSKLMDQVV
jgi:hypothetical protein